MREWRGKRYWLVGASEGLGRGLAFALSRVGAEVIVSDATRAPLDGLVEALPGKARAVAVDVTDRASVEAAANEAGEIDGLVYLAGAYWPMTAGDWDTGRAEEMADINFTGAMRTLGAVIGPMRARGRGHIVLTGSVATSRLPGALGFAASKAAVISLAESLRADLEGTGIEVQLVNPGFVRGDRSDAHDLPASLIMDADAAARSYFEHMNGDAFRRNFPWGPARLLGLGRLLPGWAFRR